MMQRQVSEPPAFHESPNGPAFFHLSFPQRTVHLSTPQLLPIRPRRTETRTETEFRAFSTHPYRLAENIGDVERLEGSGAVGGPDFRKQIAPEALVGPVVHGLVSGPPGQLPGSGLYVGVRHRRVRPHRSQSPPNPKGPHNRRDHANPSDPPSHPYPVKIYSNGLLTRFAATILRLPPSLSEDEEFAPNVSAIRPAYIQPKPVLCVGLSRIAQIAIYASSQTSGATLPLPKPLIARRKIQPGLPTDIIGPVGISAPLKPPPRPVPRWHPVGTDGLRAVRGGDPNGARSLIGHLRVPCPRQCEENSVYTPPSRAVAFTYANMKRSAHFRVPSEMHANPNGGPHFFH